MSAGQDFASIRSSSVAEVISAVPPQPFNPTAMSRLEGRPVVRSPEYLRPHPALVELDWVGLIGELNGARLTNQSVPEPILITTNGTLLADFGHWRSAVFDGRHEINCIEYPLGDDEALQFIIRHHQPQHGWNAFIRIRLALKLEPYFQKKALDNMRSGGKYKGLANLPEAQHIDVREEIARAAGVGARNVSNVRTILEVAHPRLLEALRDGTLTINRAIQFCKLPRAEQLEQFIRYSEERATNKVIRRTIARPKEVKISPDVVSVLDALQRQEARQPGSLAVRFGRHKRTVVLSSYRSRFVSRTAFSKGVETDMKYQHPLKTILSQALPYWDRDDMRPAVRKVFGKAVQCRTPALGAEFYASENHERIVYHTCKSRACPSCGYRANVQLRERWAALPEALYNGITFTMPNQLWPLFRDNPPLAKALSALAADLIQARVSARYGLRIGVIAILHTFNGRLEFNSHIHTMLTGGGLHGSSDTWVSRVYYDRDLLMKSWRKAVIALLRAALRAGLLRTELTADQMEDLLTHLEKCWWSIKIQSFEDKGHFLQYAGRYVRRPPIAQRRITWIGERTVRFWFKDKKLRRRVEVQCSLEEFIDRWSQHIPERYQHAVRSFGLFAPRALRQTSAAVFTILGQERRPRPKPRPWADSVRRRLRI
jgi:hypothetical protein